MTLLPPNSTAAERAMEGATARISDVPVPVRDVWNPDTCPEHLLPWLAWTLSVEAWASDWPAYRKRAVIRNAMDMARRKGTRGAVVGALSALGASATITEWYETNPKGTPHTFRVDLAGSPTTTAMQDQMALEIERTKPLRSHFTINWGAGFAGGVNVAGVIRAGFMMRLSGTAAADITAEPYTDPSGSPYTAPGGQSYTLYV